jgi:predicted esterase
VTGLTTEYKLAGLCCLSGYLPLRSKIFTMASEANQNTPIFWGHGDADGVVAYAWGKASADLLMTRKHAVDFHSYPNMGHGSCADETADVFEFLKSALP